MSQLTLRAAVLGLFCAAGSGLLLVCGLYGLAAIVALAGAAVVSGTLYVRMTG